MDLGPRTCKFPACRPGPLLKGLRIWEKWVKSKIGPFWSPWHAVGELDQILNLFNVQTKRPRASPASLQGPLLNWLSIWEKQADQTFRQFWSPGPGWENLIKILSLFNMQKGLGPHLQVSSM